MRAPQSSMGKIALPLILAAAPSFGWAWFDPAAIGANRAINFSLGDARLRAMQQVFQRDDRVESNKAAPPTLNQPASTTLFVIAHDPAVSAQARQIFVEGLAKSSGPAVANDTDKVLGDVQTTFSRMVKPYGLRGDDFSDVMTAYLIVMWMSANRQTALPRPAQVQAVRSQMRGVFSSAAGRVNDVRQRQALAETVMYQTCLAVVVREQAQSQSKPELLDSLAAAIDRSMSKQGFQLRMLALTDRGLIKR